ILKTFPDRALIPAKLLTICEQINLDKDGSCFRYHLNKDKKPYFNYFDKLNFGKILVSYLDINDSMFSLKKICEPHNFGNKRISWDLTFHLGETKQIGHIRTQYDQCIELLIEAILLDNRKIDKLYIPLLFL